MKKITLLLIITIVVYYLPLIHGIAQNAEATIELKMKAPTAIYSAIDSSGNYVFIFQSSSQLQYSFFNASHQANGNIVITRPVDSKKDDIIGTQLDGDLCIQYLHNNKKATVSAIILNKTNGQNALVHLGQFSFADKYLKSFLLDGIFYILTVPQNQNQIDVWTINENKLEKESYPIEMQDLYGRLSAKNNTLNDETNSSVGIDKINYDLENNVKSAQSSKKIYAYQNKIFLTFDDAENTHFIQIDLANKTAQYRQLQFSLDKSLNSYKKQGNSFLYKDVLFRATINPDQLNVSIIRLDSLLLLANYNAYPHTKITFKNGPILQEGNNDKQKIIDDNAIYFKRVLASNVSIAATKKDSLFVLEIGGYEKITNNGGNGPGGLGGPSISMGMGMGGMGGMGVMGMGMGGMGMGMGGMGMGMGGMGMGGMGMGGMGYGMGMPGYYGGYPGYYPYNSNYTSIRTVYFHSLINSSTYEHEAGIVPISLRERVSNFENTVFRDKVPELIQIVDLQTEIIIGFVIPNRSAFKTYSFGK